MDNWVLLTLMWSIFWNYLLSQRPCPKALVSDGNINHLVHVSLIQMTEPKYAKLVFLPGISNVGGKFHASIISY